MTLIGWSQGGPRAGGYAAHNPGKEGRLLLLARAYTADLGAAPPQLPRTGAATLAPML